MKFEARNIGYSYGADFSVDGLSFLAEGGGIIGLVGPNGAGKSTLLKMLAGLMEPRQGAILLDGKSLSHFDARRVARKIAYLPQQRRAYWSLSVRSLVELGRMPHMARFKGKSGSDDDAVAHAMTLMDVDGFAERAVSTLSGGEQARVFVARALAQDCKIILADEPVAGLDPGHQLALFKVFHDLAKRGYLIILALHELSLAARYCNSVLVMKSGKLKGYGSPDEVLNEAMLADVYGIQAYCGAIGDVPVILPIGDILSTP